MYVEHIARLYQRPSHLISMYQIIHPIPTLKHYTRKRRTIQYKSLLSLTPAIPRTIDATQKTLRQQDAYCFFFPAPFFSSANLSNSLISFSSALFAYHCPACSTRTPTSTSAKIVLLAANTLSVSSLLM
jgi:hypothetical protein